MTPFLQFLDGKKTYITGFAAAVMGVLVAQGAIDQKTGDSILVVLGFLILTFLRLGVKKSGPIETK